MTQKYLSTEIKKNNLISVLLNSANGILSSELSTGMKAN